MNTSQTVNLSKRVTKLIGPLRAELARVTKEAIEEGYDDRDIKDAIKGKIDPSEGLEALEMVRVAWLELHEAEKTAVSEAISAAKEGSNL